MHYGGDNETIRDNGRAGNSRPRPGNLLETSKMTSGSTTPFIRLISAIQSTGTKTPIGPSKQATIACRPCRCSYVFFRRLPDPNLELRRVAWRHVLSGPAIISKIMYAFVNTMLVARDDLSGKNSRIASLPPRTSEIEYKLPGWKASRRKERKGRGTSASSVFFCDSIDYRRARFFPTARHKALLVHCS